MRNFIVAAGLLSLLFTTVIPMIKPFTDSEKEEIEKQLNTAIRPENAYCILTAAIVAGHVMLVHVLLRNQTTCRSLQGEQACSIFLTAITEYCNEITTTNNANPTRLTIIQELLKSSCIAKHITQAHVNTIISMARACNDPNLMAILKPQRL